MKKKLCLILSLSLTLCCINPILVKGEEIQTKTEISQTTEDSIVGQQDKYYRIDMLESENIKVDFSVSGYIDQTDWMNAFGNYIHQEKQWGITPNISISDANLVLSPSTSTDKPQNTNVQFQPQN